MLTARSSLSITPSAAPLSEEHIDETTPLAVDSLGIAEEPQEIETAQTLPLAMLVNVSELVSFFFH